MVQWVGSWRYPLARMVKMQPLQSLKTDISNRLEGRTAIVEGGDWGNGGR